MDMPEKIRISIDLLEKLKKTVDPNPKKVAALADEVGTTVDFLHQIVRVLGSNGLITVIKGPGGGVVASFNKTDAYSVYRAFGYLEDEEVKDRKSDDVKKQLKELLRKVEL